MTIRQDVECWLNKVTSAQAQACTRAPTTLPSHTHTHTQKYVTLFAFPRQQWFRERASVLYVLRAFPIMVGACAQQLRKTSSCLSVRFLCSDFHWTVFLKFHILGLLSHCELSE